MGQIILIPQPVQTIIATLKAAGHEAYIVGGCVRDALLQREPDDWDITTDAEPAEVRKLFRRTVPTGIAHGTVTVLIGKTGYEVTTYRVDGVYEDARHPKEVTFTKSLAEDLKRRDFTINAMAYNDEDGLVDLFDGRGDLERRIVRCVGNAEERFSEDALRMMRAYRFAAQLGFSVEEETARAAVKLADTLPKISAERIRDELMKLLCSEHPERITDLYGAGLTKWFLPEFDRCMETEQNNPHHFCSVGEHTVLAMCAIRPDADLRLTMLLHDMAKPDKKTTDENGIDHFKGHAAAGREKAAKVLNRLKFDNRTAARVKNLVEHHDITIGKAITPQTVRKMVHTVGKTEFPLLIEVMEADDQAKAPSDRQRLRERTDALRSVYEQIVAANDPVDLKDLAVTGNDLIAQGIPAGKEIGVLLKRMLREVLRDPAHNTKAYLLDERQIRHFTSMQDRQEKTGAG